MSSPLRSSLELNMHLDDVMHYQNPFKIPEKKYSGYESDTENNDLIPEDWMDYGDLYDESRFFIFELEL